MDRVFKSKVGWWYHLILLVMATSTVAAFVGGKSPVTMIVLLLFTLECIHMLLSTWYKITADGYLIAHCSIFPEKKISISEISAVEVTVMPVSSYALSLDRLIIYKGDTQWLLISPVNKQDFVKLLKKHNPDIRIKEPVILKTDYHESTDSEKPERLACIHLLDFIRSICIVGYYGCFQRGQI